MTVKVIEHFHLSRQYTPQNLMPIYEASILLELKAYNALLYSLMHDSKKVFYFRGYPLPGGAGYGYRRWKGAGAFTDSGENFL